MAEPTPEVPASLHEEALLLQQLIDDLQDLSLAEAGEVRIEPATTDVTRLLEMAVAAQRRAAEAAGVGLTVEADAGLEARLDPVRIRQMMGNLIDNARRHTPEGGSMRILGDVAAGIVSIRVVDTGEGIDAAHLPNIFERLYRVDPSRARATGGTGLGLAICREIVKLHGGTIAVASEPGEGTTFTVRLPVGALRPLESAVDRPRSSSCASRGGCP